MFTRKEKEGTLTHLALILEVQSVARQAENSCFSTVSGANLHPERYAAARKLNAACSAVIAAGLEEKKRLNPATDEVAESGFGLQGATFQAAPLVEGCNAVICICQRAYDGLPTGMNHIDRWVENLGWPKDWLRTVYHNPFGESDDFDIEFGREVKFRLEANCPALVHYSSETSDLLDGGRAVYTSSDVEKNRELQDAMEEDLWLASNPAELRKRREYRGDDADLVDGEKSSDALAHQRRPDTQEDAVEKKDVQLSFDASTLSRAERKAIREAQFGPDEPMDEFRVQYAVNLSRIRAKNEQARRDVWNLIRKLDEDSQALFIAYVKEAKNKGKSFVTIRANIRRSVDACLAHTGVVL